jgi:LPXTG-motif cell wall-anchored protein
VPVRLAAQVAILARVRTPRWLATCMLLAALALAVPAVTLASGGGSAGDQQYTDPFAGTPAPSKSKPKTTATTPPPATSSTPAPAAPTTAPAPTSATPIASTSSSSDPTTPTATIASSTAGTLPHTGYDGWLAAALGFALVSSGLLIRARLRRT